MAMMTYSHKGTPETIRTVAAAALTGSLAVLGAVIASKKVHILQILNTTDVEVAISIDDSSNDQFIIPAAGSLTLDLKANSLHLVEGSQVYVREVSAAGSGSVHMSVIGGGG